MTDGWLPDLTQSTGTKYQAIADALDAAIVRGDLRRGDRLPPQREVAAKLGVDLTTVTKAYDAARLRGLIEARGRAGSFVAATHEPIVPPPLVDTGMNMPPEISGGLLSRAINETSAALLAGSEMAWLQYAPAGGAEQDRAAGAALLTRRGLPSGEEQVIVTAGGQNALHAILTSTLGAGDVVACGRFIYPGFKALAERLGLTLLPLEAIDAATLEAACRVHPVRALYVVPTNDNPTASTVSEAERAAIAGVVRHHALQVIEDDAYGLLASDPIPPIAAFAPEHCWYVASLSKIVTPALRVAFVRTPSVGSAIRLATDVHETAIMAPPLNAAMVSRWIGDGMFERLVSAMRGEIAWRQALAESLLGDLAGARSAEGYHLWLPLPGHLRADDLAAAMRPHGLSVVGAGSFAVGDNDTGAVRVSLGGLLDRERLARALRVLHGHLSQPIGKATPLV
ncbi:MAG: PLP-dependent aminotransferase family protein [Sphingomonas sp.]|jgi:DNA-binding transcriptional MocR family regulator|uniref:aminotransferase-like domain-containing protein n=1 Tax=Sphingomonas sp. TaxID=28214 RepID=UPI0035692870